LLERLKHFFSVPNVQFVLGVHLEQLEVSVQAAYGSGIDARTYLQKFVHFVFPLVDTPRHPDQVAQRRYIEHLSALLMAGSAQPRTVQRTNDFLAAYASRTNLSLRSIERIYSSLAICLATIPERRLAVGPLLAGLSILKIMEPALYISAKREPSAMSKCNRFLAFGQNVPNMSQ
jgi:hypothetical protein